MTRRIIQRGFTIIELMVGLVIGLITCAAIMQIMVTSEGVKRTTTSAINAQVNGSLALGAMVTPIQSAGYGFSSLPTIIGCTLENAYKGSSLTDMPPALVPVIITAGADAKTPDSIRSIAGNKASYSVPIRVVSPGYKPADQVIPVASVRGVKGPDAARTSSPAGDLMVLAADASSACQLFQVSSDSTTAQINRVDDGVWNPGRFPSASYADGAFAINLGSLSDNTFSISGSDLMQKSLFVEADGSASYKTNPIFNNIVHLIALYGKDTDGDGKVDTWDKITPTTNAGWLQVIAVRLAIVSRSTQMEKEDVTFESPSVDVGTTGSFAGSSVCGSSKCLAIDVSYLPDWKKYRYRTFDTTIPLRNMLWSS
jgi:type IV pilus assembly protein PilW